MTTSEFSFLFNLMQKKKEKSLEKIKIGSNVSTNLCVIQHQNRSLITRIICELLSEMCRRQCKLRKDFFYHSFSFFSSRRSTGSKQIYSIKLFLSFISLIKLLQIIFWFNLFVFSVIICSEEAQGIR